jgi:hypothetical protein
MVTKSHYDILTVKKPETRWRDVPRSTSSQTLAFEKLSSSEIVTLYR